MKLFITVTLLFLVGAVLAQDDAAQPPQPVEDGEDVGTDEDGVAVDPEGKISEVWHNLIVISLFYQSLD